MASLQEMFKTLRTYSLNSLTVLFLLIEKLD